MDYAIKIEDVSKAYLMGKVGSGMLIKDVERWMKKLKGQAVETGEIDEWEEPDSKKGAHLTWSLRNINLEIKTGDTLGIAGANGAGKSTLLKILSRVTAPTSGRVLGNGRLVSLLEVGTGFHPELTGRENIFLNGSILGMKRNEIKEKLEKIIAFANISKYIDTPVKRYSSGMYVRLGFAIAAFLDAEILILDEVLAVGDVEFQKKCIEKISELNRSEGKTIIFVSHDLHAMAQLCKTGLLLTKGRMETVGPMSDVISRYLTRFSTSPAFERVSNIRGDCFINRMKVVDNRNEIASLFGVGDSVQIDFEIAMQAAHTSYSLFVLVLDGKKRRVFACESTDLKEQIRLTIKAGVLVRGSYSFTVLIHTPELYPVDWVEDVCKFSVFDNETFLVKHGDYDYGVTFGKYDWQ